MKFDFRSSWRDWTIFGLRWVLLIAAAAAMYIHRTQTDAAVQSADIFTSMALPLAVGIVANLVFAAILIITAFKEFSPYVLVITDWVIAAALGYMSEGEPILLVGLAGALMVISFLRLNVMWSVIQAVGVVMATFGAVVAAVGADKLETEFQSYIVPLLILALLAAITAIWSYVQEEQLARDDHQRQRDHAEKLSQIEDMEKRARAISQMANTLSSTLNFDTVMEAALNIGQTLRTRPNQRVVGMVMLFDTTGILYVATSRGLMHTDEARTIPGRDGIVGHALAEGLPKIGGDASKDAELATFASFGGIRSVLCIPLRAEYNNWGVLLFGSDVPHVFNSAHLETLRAIGTQVTLALHNAQLYSNLMEEKDRLVQLEAEGRKELARDIHDHPAQIMAAVSMRMDIIRRCISDPNMALRELEETKKLADQAHKQIRHILTELYPLALENQGLIGALSMISREMKDKYGQEVIMQLTPELEAIFNKHQQGVIYSLITEAVTNASEHAESPIVTVTAMRQADEMVIQITDKGKGFDVQVAKKNERGRYGLENLYRRTESLNGVLDIKSALGRGTRIMAVIPIRESTKPRRPSDTSSMLNSQTVYRH